jgi:hypothetical protein
VLVRSAWVSDWQSRGSGARNNHLRHVHVYVAYCPHRVLISWLKSLAMDVHLYVTRTAGRKSKRVYARCWCGRHHPDRTLFCACVGAWHRVSEADRGWREHHADSPTKRSQLTLPSDFSSRQQAFSRTSPVSQCVRLRASERVHMYVHLKQLRTTKASFARRVRYVQLYATLATRVDPPTRGLGRCIRPDAAGPARAEVRASTASTTSR